MKGSTLCTYTSVLSGILDFFYPITCEVCGRLLNKGERVLCTYCVMELPRTGFHNFSDNPVAALFWGRIKLDHASAFIYFEKGSSYQVLFHKLKYQGRKDIGIEMGKLYGTELKGTAFARADLVVPVPLHPSKERKRGYNQSLMIASGLSDVLNINLEKDNLVRKRDSGTQTRKGRYERFLNMDGIFDLRDQNVFRDCSVILVDDVVTTGSTLEGCGTALLQADVGSLMVLTLAVA